uniref:ASH n=1 Tax=Mesovelia mulsanti TaxID=236398 RepID=A0A445NKQ9_9HEMI|nr:ASH [Mesovelia mulsanti]
MTSVVGKPLREAVIVENSAAKETRGSVLVDNTEARCKRRVFAYGGMQPASVARRNARERNRVKQVNNGFATLRSHIPVSVAAALGAASPGGRGASKKLSKVETLRLAVEYIRSLQDMLEESGGPGAENFYKERPISPPSSDVSSSPPPSTASPYDGHYQTAVPTPSYEPMSPEDEELLDVISWWQQSQ